MCLSNLLFWAAQDRAEARRAAAEAEKAAEDADNAGSAASGGMGLFGALSGAASGTAANADQSGTPFLGERASAGGATAAQTNADGSPKEGNIPRLKMFSLRGLFFKWFSVKLSKDIMNLRASKVNHVRKNTCFVQLSAHKFDCDLLGADMKIPYSLTYTSDHFE